MTEDMPQGKRTVSDSQIISAIENHEDPFVRADEVASEFEHTRQWAHNRLEDLHQDGRVEKKGSRRSVIWWVPEQ